MKLARAVYHALPYRAQILARALRYQVVSRISTERWVRRQWRRRFGYELRLDRPETFNERLQWLKVYGEQRPDVFGDVELARRCADKVGVREYVRQTLGEEYLVPTLGVYSRLQDVPLDDLPDSFVLKASHDSGSTVIVTDKRELHGRLRDALRFLEFRLSINYGLLTKEWVYNEVVPKVVVEELLSADYRNTLWDYKVFVFRGEPRLIQVDVDRFGDHRRCFYTTDWKKTDLAIRYPWYEGEVERPTCLMEMLEHSSLLARPFRHARVDWYILDDKPLLGEITFFPGSGFLPFSDRKWELEMGRWMAW
jgi:hypothetical protein